MDYTRRQTLTAISAGAATLALGRHAWAQDMGTLATEAAKGEVSRTAEASATLGPPSSAKSSEKITATPAK
ncbi:MAG: hypothetical protein JSW68_11490, partial [Burkholderiales bacterium]